MNGRGWGCDWEGAEVMVAHIYKKIITANNLCALRMSSVSTLHTEGKESKVRIYIPFGLRPSFSLTIG